MYQLKIDKLAERQIANILSEYIRREVVELILGLQDEPRPTDSQLEDELIHRFRLKVNGWRVIYKIDEDDKVVTVLAVRKRNRNTYLNVP